MDKVCKKYNESLKQFGDNFRALNNYVMTHTYNTCTKNPAFIAMIDAAKMRQYIVFDYNEVAVPTDGPTTNIIVSSKRTFEAAKSYKGKKTAVLNFANNHSIGGRPYSSGAQEESLCRTSTLLPCLEKEADTFYNYHIKLYKNHELDDMGNDDLIYTPGVVVFKSDESAPRMMKIEDWFDVDVITCAAPIIHGQPSDMQKYQNLILKRLRKVIQVAKVENVEVLILGAWGCGAFHNLPEVVASAFKTLCDEYKFDTIEFAIDTSNGDLTNYQVFKQTFNK